MDGDGITDIISAASNAAFFMKGNGNGTFRSPVTISQNGVEFRHIEATDLNNDGRLDFVVNDYAEGFYHMLQTVMGRIGEYPPLI